MNLNGAYKIIFLITVAAAALFVGAYLYINSLTPKPVVDNKGPAILDSNPIVVPDQQTPTDNPDDGIIYDTPGAGGTDTTPGPTMTLPTAGGGTVTAKDITKDPAAGKYPAEGYYYIGYHAPVDGVNDPTATENPPYQILYIDTTKYFNITLFEEPIGQIRKDAESYLMARLGLGESDMCQLNYTVTVPNRVNQFYAGEDFRFSFCVDAVQL